MPIWDRLVALLLLIFAVYAVAAARAMMYMQGRVPGPGFMPFWIGVGIAVAALMILAGPGRRRSREETPAGVPASSFPTGQGFTVITMIVVTVAGVALITPLGMAAALGLTLLALVRLLGASWRTAALTAVGLPLALHLLFALGLKVPLPSGPWGF